MATMTIRPAKDGYVLESSIRVPHGLDEVFRFFSDARNLELVTPPFVRFRIVTPTPLEMREGLLIDYALRIHGLPMRWRSEITAWDPPHRFVDTQVRGPYRRWVHEHRFTDLGQETLVEDRVEYRVPGGRLAHRLFVRRDVERIFEYRSAALRRLLADDPDLARNPR
jgi:ligand-binding SRPBCC domain-containing protein